MGSGENMVERLTGRLSAAAIPVVLQAASAVIVASILSGCGDTAESGASRAAESEAFAGVELDEPVAKPDFVMTRAATGGPFDFRAETDGYVTLLFIGYTYCPDVCPVHMGNLAAVMRDLPSRVTDRLKVVFVTSDPQRDTPERLREWLSGFDPSFIGLRGTREQVRSLESALGVAPSVVDSGQGMESEAGGSTDGEESDYFVGHAAQVLAFGLDDTARVAYPWGTRQRDWVTDLPRLVEAVPGGTPDAAPAGATGN